MSCYWLFITFSWIGSASLQYINTAGPGAEAVLDPEDSSIHYPPLPYLNYIHLPESRNDYETFQNENHHYQEIGNLMRRRRTAEEEKEHWEPVSDLDKTIYIRNDETGSPFIVQGYAGTEENATDVSLIGTIEKKSFSPWGGKRNSPTSEHMWTWKRTASIREPSMPKRVRFNPWGGKRSGQMIYKPGTKGSKIIFSASVPELTRIVSNYSPNGEKLDAAGYQFIPTLDKRHPIKILALSTNMDDRNMRDALPFKRFLETMPRLFKSGHPYLDINLKKDGKRKVKFSAWGGKRSPPIIGPIWTPASQNIKDSALDTIVLIRNMENDEAKPV